MGKIDGHSDERLLTLVREARRELRVARRTLRYSPRLFESAAAVLRCHDSLRAALDAPALTAEALAYTRALADGRPPGATDSGETNADEMDSVDSAALLELRDQLDTLSRAIASREHQIRAAASWGARLRSPSPGGLLAALAVAGLVLAGIAGEPPGKRPWRASFHRGLALGSGPGAGNPVVRYWPRLDFDWQRRSPVPGLAAGAFSVRFDSCLMIPELPSGAAQLRFSLQSDADARVSLDQRPLMVGWSSRGNSRQSAVSSLEPGRHHLQIEYRHARGPAQLEFSGEVDGRALPHDWLASPPRPFRSSDPCRLSEDPPQ